MAYYNKEKLATEDAMRIGRLHTFLPGDKSSTQLCVNHELSLDTAIHMQPASASCLGQSVLVQGGRAQILPS